VDLDAFLATKAVGGARVATRCDAEIEHNGPGVIDRWTAEVFSQAIRGKPPSSPRVLSLSSSHSALLCRHLRARGCLVGCDAHFEDRALPRPGDEGYSSSGSDVGGARGGRASSHRLERVNAWNPNLRKVAELSPSLVVCAYDASAEALRAIAPTWENDDPRALSFEIAVLKCPLGRGAIAAAAAQFGELARLVRVRRSLSDAAARALTDGLAALRVRAERELGIADADSRDENWPRRKKPFVFVEADPDLYSADSCTPLGAALAEALGVGNIADPSANGEDDAPGARSRPKPTIEKRAAAALEARKNGADAAPRGAVLDSARTGLVDRRAPFKRRRRRRRAQSVRGLPGPGGREPSRRASRGTRRSAHRPLVRRREPVDARARGRRARSLGRDARVLPRRRRRRGRRHAVRRRRPADSGARVEVEVEVEVGADVDLVLERVVDVV
jgi:hypothetical protein